MYECAEDERLSNGVRGQRHVCWCTCSHDASQCNKVGAKPFANHHHVPLSKYSRFSPCALLFLQVPTTVSSAPWHFSWLRRRSLPERLFPRLCGQQDMATRRCVDSVWVCHHCIAAAATTPTPYRCRLHHQLLRPQSFLSCPRPVLRVLSQSFRVPQQLHPLHWLQHRTPICLSRRPHDEL